MRITSGTARGLPLQSPKTDLRPSMDRLRSALFSMVGQDLDGIRVLDLFAGTGSLGIEALSRGAEHAMFIEADPTAVECIKQNLTKAKLDDRAQVIRSDVFAFLASPVARVHLILADPPYLKTLGEHDLAAKLLLDTRLPKHLRDKGVLVIEHNPHYPPSNPAVWDLIDSRSYGKSALSFFRTKLAVEPTSTESAFDS
jgi:16S rRNA (guanine966-N2)-methyltransferase